MKPKITTIILLFLITISLLNITCEKKEYTEIVFSPLGWSTDVPLEFYIDGERLNPRYPQIVPEHRPGNMFLASEGGIEKVTIDYKITYNNQIYSSIDGGISPPFELYADESSYGSEFTIRPTGNVNDPWDIAKEDDDNSACFIGTWTRQDMPSSTCEVQKYNFSSNGTGWASRMFVTGYDDNCSIVCKLTFNFTWEDKGNNTVYCKYTSIDHDCSTPANLPSPENIQVICNGSYLTIQGNEFR